MTQSSVVTLSDTEHARATIGGAVNRTPMATSPSLSSSAGAPVTLTLEHHQITGSFMIRGPTNTVNRLSAEPRNAGVVGVSTGSHGRGLACAARGQGICCIVCISALVPQNKIDGIKAQGAEVASSAVRKTRHRSRSIGWSGKRYDHDPALRSPRHVSRSG